MGTPIAREGDPEDSGPGKKSSAGAAMRYAYPMPVSSAPIRSRELRSSRVEKSIKVTFAMFIYYAFCILPFERTRRYFWADTQVRPYNGGSLGKKNPLIYKRSAFNIKQKPQKCKRVKSYRCSYRSSAPPPHLSIRLTHGIIFTIITVCNYFWVEMETRHAERHCRPAPPYHVFRRA
jgi:hypothetical protein